jgi:hypothetical protein
MPCLKLGANAMDSVYENAQRRREELRRELEEIDLFLRLHQKFSGGTKTEPVATSDDTRAASEESHPVLSRPERKRNLPKHMMAKEVRKMILERRVPMTRTDIVEALELKGIPVAGRDKSKAIGTIMWRMRDRFRNIEGLGYWPIDLPYPPEPIERTADRTADRNDFFGPLPSPSVTSPERKG